MFTKQKFIASVVKGHLEYIDFAKGLGIIMVVMGHTIFPLHEAISIFHMPLFFFIAGLTLRKYSDFSVFTINKINRIFIPYLFFSAFWAVFNFFCPLLIGSDGPLWFLPTMFASLITCQILIKYDNVYLRSSVILICIIITYFLCSKELSLLPFNLDRMFRAVFYLYLGYIFASSRCLKFVINDNRLITLSFFVLFLAIYILGLFFMLKKGLILEGEGFMRGEPYGKSFVLVYVTSLAGILATLTISAVARNISIINWLGKNSLVILCVHYPFTQYWNTVISQTSLYESWNGRIACAILSYVIIMGFCVPWIYVCKRFVPKLTGYESLL